MPNQAGLALAFNPRNLAMSDTTASPEHPSNGNGVAHPDPIMAAWQRYQIIKGSDNEKNKLIEVRPSLGASSFPRFAH
jgi:hypothetical protein